MKSIISPAILAMAAALTGNCLALTPIDESFKDSTLDPMRWYQTRYGKGSLAPIKGKLNFVASPKSSKDDYAVIELLTSQPGFNENWELIVDLTNTTSFGSKAGCGIMLNNAQDRNDYMFLNFFGRGVLKDGKRSDGGLFAAVITNGKHQDGATTRKIISVSKGAIRIRFNKNKKLLTLSLSLTQKADGYKWLDIGSFSPTGSGGDINANWQMNAGSGRFGILLFGFGVDKVIEPGKVRIDNFSLGSPN